VPTDTAAAPVQAREAEALRKDLGKARTAQRAAAARAHAAEQEAKLVAQQLAEAQAAERAATARAVAAEEKASRAAAAAAAVEAAPAAVGPSTPSRPPPVSASELSPSVAALRDMVGATPGEAALLREQVGDGELSRPARHCSLSLSESMRGAEGTQSPPTWVCCC
jgi:hypothetical protein